MASGFLYIKKENFKFDEARGQYFCTIPPFPLHIGNYNSIIIDVTKEIVIDGDFHKTYYDSDSGKWKEQNETIAACPFSMRFESEEGNVISGEIPGDSRYRVRIRVDSLANILYNEDDNNYGIVVTIREV